MIRRMRNVSLTINHNLIPQNQMVNQGQNHIDSPANMLQQQASYEVSAMILSFHSLIGRKRKKTSANRLRLISLLLIISPLASQRPEKKVFPSPIEMITFGTFATHTEGLGHGGVAGWKKIDCYYRHLRSATFAFSS
jgi:hypothetical protein